MDTQTIANNIAKTVEVPAMLDHLSGDYDATRFSDSLRQALTMRVSSVLQTTLDTNELIELFAQTIKPAIPFEGLVYVNTELNLFFQTGHSGEFNSTYRLVAHNEKLGELRLSRKWALSSEEIQIFEYLLCTLIYPLRNSLRYHQALMASLRDPLTNAYNRSTFDESLQREISLSRRYDRPLALIMLDIDHFKAINDSLGHANGDCAIRALAEQTAHVIRSTDILFRYGGEEFVILLNNTDMHGASLLAERIRTSIEELRCVCHQGNPLRMTVSLGVAELGIDDNGNSFFDRADRALYLAKKSGRNCVRSLKS
ncbi:MAG: GGDEF domain-containing protein [Gammaproteobacteria bacterium]|nr:GGDEF domain-containing protein [Gammaproteobacteria bacterium]